MSTTFAMAAQDIINQCLLQQQWLDYTQTADSTKLAQMLTALQAMVKRWGSKGIKVWTVEQVTFSFVPGQYIYSIGPSGYVMTDRPLRIDFALIRPTNGGSDIPLNALARQDWLMLGNKTQAGTPNSYFYDPQLVNGNVYFYLDPDSFNSGAYNPYLYIRAQLQDIGGLTQTMMFPQEWYDPLIWGLAYETRLMNKVPREICAEIKETYATFLKEAEDWDREYAPVTFGIDFQQGCFGDDP